MLLQSLKLAANSGPLTSEYYDQLSEFLGDEWMQIAEGLGLGQPAIQRIVQANVHHENPADRVRQSAREALIQWHRSSTKFDSGSKVRLFNVSLELLSKLSVL